MVTSAPPLLWLSEIFLEQLFCPFRSCVRERDRFGLAPGIADHPFLV